MKRLVLAAVMLVLCGVPGNGAQEDVTGSWAMKSPIHWGSSTRWR